MMPSRGLHIARGKLPRIYQNQIKCRNLSTTPRPNLRIASTTRSSIAPTSTPWARSPSIAIPSIAAKRHASTVPDAQKTAEAAASTTPPPSLETTSFANLDTINLDNIHIDPSAIPGHLGYLKQIGIDFGFGPTSAIQWALEHIHVWGGLPWWATIFVTGAALRLTLFPLFLKMSDSSARQMALSSVTKPFYERMQKAKDTGDTAELMRAWSQIGAVHKRAGVSSTAQFLPLGVQAILGFCGFRLLRAMVTLPVPGLADGGFLWVKDLSMTDGYLLLPLFMAGFVHVIARMGGEAGAAAQIPPQMKKILMYGMPALVFGITAFQPAGLALWFCGTGAVGMLQGRALQNESFRKFFKLAPMYKPSKGEGLEGGMFGALMSKQLEQANSNAKVAGNTTFMHTSYQAPKVHTAGSSRTIDAKLVDKSARQQPASDMVQPQKKGIFDGITDFKERAQKSYADVRDKLGKMTEKTEEQKREAAKDDYKARAAAYEKQHAQRRTR